MIFEVTYQVRVTDISVGQRWYAIFLNKTPDFIPHEGFAEWELIPGCWLQVVEGMPSGGSGPLRIGVKDIMGEKERLCRELKVDHYILKTRSPGKMGQFYRPLGKRYWSIRIHKQDRGKIAYYDYLR